MANFNRQTDNRKAKKKRRRREAIRTAEKWQAEAKEAEARGEKPVDLDRRIRELRRKLRHTGRRLSLLGGRHRARSGVGVSQASFLGSRLCLTSRG